MKKIPLTGTMLLLAASTALAGGLNFNWNTNTQCPAAADQYAAKMLTWDCTNPATANSGEFFMVASVMPNFALVGFQALDARIEGWSEGPLPAWWAAVNPGSCRVSAFIPGLPPAIPTAPCAGNATTKLWTGLAYGGMGTWVTNAQDPGMELCRFYTVVGFAMNGPRAANLSTTTEYNAFNIAMLTTNSVDVPESAPGADDGVVACAGCGAGVTLVLTQVGLYGSAAEDQVYFPISSPNASQVIVWQGGGHFNWEHGGWCTVAARNTTWGQIKSLYR